MSRRLVFAAFLIFACAAAASPKWKQEEQDYLDTQFKAILDQVQALKAQVDTLNARLAELRQNQEKFQAVIVRQEQDLQALEKLVTTVRTANDDGLTNLKGAIAQLRTEQQKAFDTLSGKVAQNTMTTTEVVPAGGRTVPGVPVSPPGIQGYITNVQGDIINIDLGTNQGIRVGSRLSVYNARDPNTRVGEIEITQVLDAASSKAKVLSMNPGVKPDFGDIVRLE